MHNASLDARLWFFLVNSPLQIRNEMFVFVFELRIYSFLMQFFFMKYFFMKAKAKCVKDFHHSDMLVSLSHTGWMEPNFPVGWTDDDQWRRSEEWHFHHWVRRCTPQESVGWGSLERESVYVFLYRINTCLPFKNNVYL